MIPFLPPDTLGMASSAKSSGREIRPGIPRVWPGLAPTQGCWTLTCGYEAIDDQQQGDGQREHATVHAVHSGVCALGLIRYPEAGLLVGAGACVGSHGDPKGAGGRSDHVPAPAF